MGKSVVVDRRGFLKSALGGAAGLSLCSVCGQVFAAANPAPAPISATWLTDNLALITGAGPNVVAARGPDGIVLVDGGQEERARDLLKFIRKEVGEGKIQALFNTHWHPGHTGLNETLGKEGVKIIAHENTKLWMGTDIYIDWQNKTYQPFPPQAIPTETFYTSGTLPFSGEEIQYGYLPQAHTDGDIYVYFPKSNVLVSSIINATTWPIIDFTTGGWIGGLAEGLKILLSVANADTRIVPAQGPVLTRADLEEQRAMFAAIFDRLTKALRQGLSPAEALALEPTKEFNAKYGDPTQFVTLAFKSLWGHMAPDA